MASGSTPGIVKSCQRISSNARVFPPPVPRNVANTCFSRAPGGCSDRSTTARAQCAGAKLMHGHESLNAQTQIANLKHNMLCRPIQSGGVV
eukprot:2725829-Amphidinium_carterae.1